MGLSLLCEPLLLTKSGLSLLCESLLLVLFLKKPKLLLCTHRLFHFIIQELCLSFSQLPRMPLLKLPKSLLTFEPFQCRLFRLLIPQLPDTSSSTGSSICWSRWSIAQSQQRMLLDQSCCCFQSSRNLVPTRSKRALVLAGLVFGGRLACESSVLHVQALHDQLLGPLSDRRINLAVILGHHLQSFGACLLPSSLNGGFLGNRQPSSNRCCSGHPELLKRRPRWLHLRASCIGGRIDSDFVHTHTYIHTYMHAPRHIHTHGHTCIHNIIQYIHMS